MRQRVDDISQHEGRAVTEAVRELGQEETDKEPVHLEDAEPLRGGEGGRQADGEGEQDGLYAVLKHRWCGDTDGCFGDTDGCFGDTDGCFGDTDGCFGDTDGCFGDTDGCLGDTDGCFGDTDGCLGDTDGCFCEQGDEGGRLPSVSTCQEVEGQQDGGCVKAWRVGLGVSVPEGPRPGLIQKT